ncbi:MAG: menaquinone biosynthesis protein [Phycisphaerae bacterium]|nr:menaquinone biosynthesis protein [Phycisphaerae bacterium]
MPSAAASNLPFRVASVNYLNARPLIEGLSERAEVKLVLDVPAKLLSGLRERRYDVALLPVIDYQRLDGLRIIPVGGIGCDGPTLTVRVFSHVPFHRITELACDPESHTSVALARIILEERYGVRPETRSLLDASNRPTEARLLIGDKVVCEEPVGFEHQLDLGAAWRELTGLPFVFAAWTAAADVLLGQLPQWLWEARRLGIDRLESIIRRYAIPRGWPAGLALQYLSIYLNYDIGPRQLQAIELFHRKAAALGLIDSPVRPLMVVPAVAGATIAPT